MHAARLDGAHAGVSATNARLATLSRTFLSSDPLNRPEIALFLATCWGHDDQKGLFDYHCLRDLVVILRS